MKTNTSATGFVPLTSSEMQMLLNDSQANVATFFAKTYRLPVDIDLLVSVLNNGVLSTCPPASLRGGGGSLAKRTLCAAMLGILLTVLTAAAVGGMAFAFMMIDKFMLCSAYSDYLKGIISFITFRQDTCAIYTKAAEQLKMAISGSTLASVSLINFRSNLAALRCVIRYLDSTCECKKDTSNKAKSKK